jgi:hypothetical protein
MITRDLVPPLSHPVPLNKQFNSTIKYLPRAFETLPAHSFQSYSILRRRNLNVLGTSERCCDSDYDLPIATMIVRFRSHCTPVARSIQSTSLKMVSGLQYGSASTRSNSCVQTEDNRTDRQTKCVATTAGTFNWSQWTKRHLLEIYNIRQTINSQTSAVAAKKR